MAKIYQGCNQNLYIIEEQTTQWPQDTKGVIRICICFLFFYDIQILITPLVYFGHCVVCSSMIYRFWLHPWYLVAIVLSVLLWYTDSDYTLGIFWPLCCLFFYDIQILITPLVYFGHFVHRRTDNTMAKRYQGCNHNLYITEEQTTQWPKDTKGVIGICIS